MLISVLCPTRGRPELAKRMLESARATESKKAEYLFYVDDDDPRRDDYKRLSKATVLVGPNLNTPIAYNVLADQAQGQMLLIMGDDCVFQTEGWDARMKESVRPEWKKDGIYIVSAYDGRELNSHGHFAIGRGWMEALGYLLPPIFRHWATNMWTTDIAEKIGRLSYRPDVVLKHEKVAEQEVKDDTFYRIRTPGVMAWDNMVKERCQKFADLDEAILRLRIKNLSKEKAA